MILQSKKNRAIFFAATRHRSRRLGICLSAQERQAAVLARYALALLRQARGEAGRSEQACLVSHVPAHLRDAPQCERGECESRAGASAPCQHESHDRQILLWSHTSGASPISTSRQKSSHCGTWSWSFDDLKRGEPASDVCVQFFEVASTITDM